jgi:hypothetical protein
VFPPRDAATNRATHTVTLPSAVTGKLSFTPKGDAQSCYKITLHATTITGVGQTNASRNTNTAIYNLQGVRVTNPQKGIYIQNGKRIVIR